MPSLRQHIEEAISSRHNSKKDAVEFLTNTNFNDMYDYIDASVNVDKYSFVAANQILHCVRYGHWEGIEIRYSKGKKPVFCGLKNITHEVMIFIVTSDYVYSIEYDPYTCVFFECTRYNFKGKYISGKKYYEQLAQEIVDIIDR